MQILLIPGWKRRWVPRGTEVKIDMRRRRPDRRSFLAGTASCLATTLPLKSLCDAAAPISGTAKFTDAEVEAAIGAGDIIDTTFDPAPAVGRYLGNGRFGSVYGKYGLHAHPSDRQLSDAHGNTQLMHMRHYGRFRFHSEAMQRDTSADYLLPVARIYWETVPQDISSYRQHQSFLDGTLHTAFTCAEGGHIAVTNWFDPEERDLAAVSLEVDGSAPAILIDATEPFVPYKYGRNTPARQAVKATRVGDQWRLEITCSETAPLLRSVLFVRTDSQATVVPQGLRITPNNGASTILVSYGKPVQDNAAKSLARTRKLWRATWLKSATFAFPDAHRQAVWVRSLAYILSTFNDDGIGFAPTNGLTGNLFPFNFAQDMLYVHSALLATGHLTVAKAWMERFHRMIPEMRLYAKKLWPNVDGIYPPWELPFGPVRGYHEPAVPIVYCYEPHNAGYLSRMAVDTAKMVDDPVWTDTIAKPLISGVASYYRSFCRKGADGLWHLQLSPAVGQDEAGGRDQRDYLCVLFSAQFSYQKAVEYDLDPDGAYASMLHDGLAFPTLLSSQGFYYTSAGAGPKDFGKQKHPVQLNALAYLPVASGPSKADRVAYKLRHEITQDASKPYFYGWTLGEMLLSGTRIGDTAGWSTDWSKLAPSSYIDPKAVQIYETSDEPFKAFYVTTHGLVITSLMENVVSDYWGDVRLGQCNANVDPVVFRNVRVLSGLTLSGRLAGRTGEVLVEAWKDVDVLIHGFRLQLRRGQRRTFSLDVSASEVPRAQLHGSANSAT